MNKTLRGVLEVLDIFPDHLFHARRPPGLSSVGGGARGARARRDMQCQFSHPISHRTPHYRMGIDSIRLLVAINKRPNFWTQRDSKIPAGIDSNSLGNRCCVMRSLTAN
jgi:hypothetical protein